MNRSGWRIMAGERSTVDEDAKHLLAGRGPTFRKHTCRVSPAAGSIIPSLGHVTGSVSVCRGAFHQLSPCGSPCLPWRGSRLNPPITETAADPRQQGCLLRATNDRPSRGDLVRLLETSTENWTKAWHKNGVRSVQ